MLLDLNLTPHDVGDGDYSDHLLQRADPQAVINAHEFQMLGDLPPRNNELSNDHRNVHMCLLDRDIMAFDLNMPAHDDLDGLAAQDHQGNLHTFLLNHDTMTFATNMPADDNPADNLDGLASQDQQDDNAVAPEQSKYKNLTDRQRTEIYAALLARETNGKLKRSTTKEVAQLFNVRLHVVQAIWRRVKQCREQGLPVNVHSRKPKNCGRKKINIDFSRVSTIPLIKRSTIRSLAQELGVAKSTLHRRFKEGQLRRHSNTLKPYLKEENKIARLQFCVRMLDQRTFGSEVKFIDMQNIVHIDEKWFYTSKKARKFYLVPIEGDPHRTIKNKNCMDKVMVLAVVARPRYDREGNCIFDGKIGVWPFIKKEPARRTSRNRTKGTLVTKSIKVDRDTMRRYLIAKVLPAITARWPRDGSNNTIWIQQDNARTHIPVDDQEFCIAAGQTGLDIRLMNQPPNSPDTNVLDLGFFASLQSLTYRMLSTNIDVLVNNVLQEFQSYDHSRLNRVFLTLQSCLLEIMKSRGGNAYKIPHMNKERLELIGTLPISLGCDRHLYESVMQILNAQFS